MDELSMEALTSALAALRADPGSEQSIRRTILSLADALDKQLSPGIRLKLRRGSLRDLMAIAAKLLPGCVYCNSVYPEATFTSRTEHARCAQSVDTALSNGILKRTTRPIWVMLDPTQLGADAYFTCATCGSIWTLVEPEQHCHGLWSRIA